MRKITIMIVLVFITLSLSGQEGYIEDMTGAQWNEWSTSTKQVYLTGFYCAMTAMAQRMAYEHMPEEEAAQEEFREWLFARYIMTTPIPDMVMSVNIFFENPDNQANRIIDVLFHFSGIAYWESQQQPVIQKQSTHLEGV